MGLKARETIYKGIRMRSRLEASFAQWLDTSYPRWSWEYEPRCYASEQGQYLVDFILNASSLNGGLRERLFVDVKPPPQTGLRSFDAFLDRMESIIKASEPEALPVVVVPSATGWVFYRNGIDFNRLLDLYLGSEARACSDLCWHDVVIKGSYWDDEIGHVPYSYTDLEFRAHPSHSTHFGIVTD